MKVIKLGGSLMADTLALTRCLQTITQNTQDKQVIVAGGGVFAEQVRTVQQQWKFDDKTAHAMAILSMQQTALLLNALLLNNSPLNTSPLSNTHKICTVVEDVFSIQQAGLVYPIIIWSPSIKQLNTASIPSNWDISADSLAAWLAGQLKATELIVVKSANIPANKNIQALQKHKILDNAFADFVKDADYKVTILNHHQFNKIQ